MTTRINKPKVFLIRSEVNVSGTGSATEPAIQQVALQHFLPGANNELQVLWRDSRGADGSPYSLAEIADVCWKQFMRAVQRNEEEKLV